MWKLNAAICDDEEFYRNEVVNLLSTYANEMGYDLETDVLCQFRNNSED